MKLQVFSENSAVSVGILVLLMTAIFWVGGFVGSVSAQNRSVDTRITSVELDLKAIKEKYAMDFANIMVQIGEIKGGIQTLQAEKNRK